MTMSSKNILIVGAGLAGVEAAYYLAEKNYQVYLLEVKGIKKNPAQKIETMAELVCTNSLKSLNPSSAHGLLKLEMESFSSIVLKTAHQYRVPAGDALAVDRDAFSKGITDLIIGHPNIKVVTQEVTNPIETAAQWNCQNIIVATGPLTTDSLSQWLKENLGEDDFYFYDAIAPVVDADTLDYSKLYFKDRHTSVDESADYLNAPMNEEEYYNFIQALIEAEKTPAKDFEEYKFFEACLPIDLMAERGPETPRFSCMKPIGLERDGQPLPFAVVQLRKENLLGSAFNLVGFQTRLKYPDQKRVFRMIPGFANAEFIHYGSVHRNTFLNAKKLLNFDFSSKKFPQLSFAGQITGVEGYTESASMGLYVAYQLHRKLQGLEPIEFPKETAMGSLINYLMTVPKPTPSSINFGLMPTIVLDKTQRKHPRRKSLKKELVAIEAQKVFHEFFKSH
jgi:methylenetetrahydrofolate--tRNA-(uracil-5-)-methyltransferase